MYFRPFPKTKYTLDNGLSYQQVQDIFRRVVIQYVTKTQDTYFRLYDIKDGETPDIVAAKLYNNSNLHWIILHANEIIDPRYEWCLSQADLLEYVKERYGSGNVHATHHYEWVLYENTDAEMRLESPDQDEFYSDIVTNYEYENRLNEERRRIKVVKPPLVPDLQTAFSRLIKV